MGTLGDVGGVELPFLAGRVEPREEALLLHVLRDVKEELDDLRPGPGEVALEAVDVLIAFLPEVLVALAGREPLRLEPLGVHLECDDLLVVRAVEDADATAFGKRFRDAPEVVVVELLGRGLLERDHLHALRIDARHHVLDRRILAGGVHRLQDDEQRVPVTGPQQLLGDGELRDAALERILRPLLELVLCDVREVRAAGPAGVSRRKAGRLAGLDDELLEKSIPNGCVHLRAHRAQVGWVHQRLRIERREIHQCDGFGALTVCVLVAKEFALETRELVIRAVGQLTGDPNTLVGHRGEIDHDVSLFTDGTADPRDGPASARGHPPRSSSSGRTLSTSASRVGSVTAIRTPANGPAAGASSPFTRTSAVTTFSTSGRARFGRLRST